MGKKVIYDEGLPIVRRFNRQDYGLGGIYPDMVTAQSVAEKTYWYFRIVKDGSRYAVYLHPKEE